MKIIKTSEKVLVWMHRTGKTQLEVSKAMNINRQALAQKIKENVFSVSDVMNLKRLGFSD